MASSSSSNNPSLLAFISLVCFFLFFIDKKEASDLQHTHHRVLLSSLTPSSSCTSLPPGGNKYGGSLEVVHKHGPCSSPSSLIIPHIEILKRDEARVRSIHAKLSKTSKAPDRIQLPAKAGELLSTGNYFVAVGLGTPTRDLSLAFDTGIDLTWTQCKPCVSFYSQKEPIFDPSQSSSYSNIPCSSSLCSQLFSATGFFPLCNSSTRTCMYGLIYGDSSISSGYFSKEKLIISLTHVFDGFLFGCGLNNTDLFNGTAGILGLGRDRISFIEQTAQSTIESFPTSSPPPRVPLATLTSVTVPDTPTETSNTFRSLPC